MGIDPDIRVRIFEPFFSTKGITGTGLGLWISREIVTKHQGSIYVRSRPTSAEYCGGTIFRIFIPAQGQPIKMDEAEEKKATGFLADRDDSTVVQAS